ncbi:MAG: hypothetical protein IJR61_06465 [Clostridia bacterium]|nr:hypothetical protein [Clostridia bacterium]
MKRFTAMFFVGVFCLALFIPAGCGNVSRYFDLSDAKVLWDGKIYEGTRVDTLVITLKRPKKYVRLKIDDFHIKSKKYIKGLDYIIAEPNKELIEDNEYMANFRQRLFLFLYIPSEATVITDKEMEERYGILSDIINQLEQIDFIKEVEIERITYS